jgi:hypothetical protein
VEWLILLGLVGIAWWLTGGSAGGSAGALMGAPTDPTSDVGPDPAVQADPQTLGISALAQAIATAEGYGVDGAIPTLANNPGDLVIPGWTGQTIGSEGIAVFSTPAEGWARLGHQLTLISSGASRVYQRSMTIADMANKWAPGAQAAGWAANVANSLGVTTDTTVDSILG